MDTIDVPEVFSEFLRSLNAQGVEYLLIGGYAVAYHGYVRPTEDLDVWLAVNPANADAVVAALREFGFDVPELTPALFLEPWRIVRMGMKPLRIELSTTISGVDFSDCYARRVECLVDGEPISIIGLDDLKQNKTASGRPKDLADLDRLP
jgi:hypothetical protein